MAMITTFQQHIQEQQQGVSKASGTFSYLLAGITLATKMIQAKIRLAAIDNIYGAIGQTNVQGEQQQKLDVYANEALLHCLGLKDCVAASSARRMKNPSPSTARSTPANTSSSSIRWTDLPTSM